jgi:DNA-binding beta-propeller fold protein YncE
MKHTPIQFAVALFLLVQIPAGADDVKPDPNLARIIQTLEAFNHPESCAVSADGQFLFVTNSALTPDGYQLGKGAISKLEIHPDGTLKMLKADFTTGLTAPLGITVLPKSTKKFRAGSLFVCTGFNWVIDDKGQRVKDVGKIRPAITVVDPESGRVLGQILMGPDTAAAKNIGHPVLQPNGICFDPDGNLYFADGGGGGDELEPAVRGRPSLKRIRHANIDAYSDNKEQGELTFIMVRHVPNGVFYSPPDDKLYWSTCDGDGPGGGAVYRMERKEFPHENMVSNVVGDINPLDGLCITPGDSLITARSQDGDIALVTRSQLGVLNFLGYEEPLKLSSPGDIKLLTLSNGYNILYIPEQEPDAKEPWKQRLRVVLLPSRL